MRLLKLLVVAGTLPASSLIGNFIVNPDFSLGPNGLDGYEAFAVWSQGATGFSSAWGLADAPVVAPGNGTAVFSMNTQLANADPFWSGATQEMTFQQNFWTPDNNAGVPSGPDLYNLELVFTGTVVVSEAYAAGNLGQAFIQFLDQSYNAVAFVSVDVTTLGPDGEFSLTALTPADGLNIIQIGFRNSGIEGTAGQMTISNISLAVIPEPSTYALIFGFLGLAWVLYRRRR
ncbi:MAG: PEP-CTERM sorting domain-containing protein [Opitutales bacterium]|nr:PEP-CTERM sorting domain-containing protein [Opitutales bacterium]